MCLCGCVSGVSLGVCACVCVWVGVYVCVCIVVQWSLHSMCGKPLHSCLRFRVITTVAESHGEAIPFKNTGGLRIMQTPNRQCGQASSSRLPSSTGEIETNKVYIHG